MQAGSEEAFTALYRYYSPRLYLNILALVRDPATAEELVQELFTRVWQKKENIAPGNFAGYLYRIGQHLVHDFFRRLKKDRRLLDSFRLLAEEDHDNGREASHYQQSYTLLQKAVDQLSPQQKRVYELVKIEGHSYKKAAEIMGISPFTVKEYLVATMKSLRNYFLHHRDESLLILFLLALSAARLA